MASTAPTAKPEEHGTLAGVLVPGGAAVALILACNILHTLGPWALIGLVALGMAGTAATLGTIARTARGSRGSRTRAARTKSTATKTPAARPAKSTATPSPRGAAVAPPRRGAVKAPVATQKAPAMAGAPAKAPAKTAPRTVDPRSGIFGRPGNNGGGPVARTPKAPAAPNARTPKTRIPTPRHGQPPTRQPGAAKTKPGKPNSPTTKSKKNLAKTPAATTRTALRRAAQHTVKAARRASPKLSRGTAATAARIARMHRRARKVRLHHPGPNWWRPLNRAWAKTLVPALKAARALLRNRHIRDWINLHRLLQPTQTPSAKRAPVVARPRTAPRSTVASPIRKESPVTHPAITAATESVQAAFAAVNGSPAESMREYEEILAAVPELLEALAAGLRGFGDISADEFAVDSTIPDMLRDGSGYALNLGAHLGEVHQQFRQVHEQQITNYEEPVVGSEKWDVRANQ